MAPLLLFLRRLLLKLLLLVLVLSQILGADWSTAILQLLASLAWRRHYVARTRFRLGEMTLSVGISWRWHSWLAVRIAARR